jgi:hypothetical protein
MKRRAKKRIARKGKALTRAQLKKVSGGMLRTRAQVWTLDDEGPVNDPWGGLNTGRRT